MSTRISFLIFMVFSISCWAGTTAIDPKVAAIAAIDGDAAYGEYLASECSTCHNLSSADNAIPVIHGKDPSYLIQALLEYRDERRMNETMRSIAGALGDEEIAALASYFSSQ